MNGPFRQGSTAMAQDEWMPVFANLQFNFGYPWWLSYGQLPLVLIAAAFLALGYWRKWSKRAMVVWAIVLVWSAGALLVTRFVLDINGVPALPTESFFSSGTGRVLDLGAGTGRSSIMVLKARPQSTLVALDLFGSSFDEHFGPGESPQERLLQNLKAAGVAQRVTIQTADMRKIPFDAGSFDAVVSAYAVDHLDGQGIRQTMAETARVIKPGGDFLLILIGKEPVGIFAFGPLLMHGGPRPPAWWTARLEEAGFQVLEQGTRPVTVYFLARRR
jgi:SAM-dependent methyltransferase